MFSALIVPQDNNGVGVAFTDRVGGQSSGALGEFNLGHSDLDEPVNLRANMAGLRAVIGCPAVVGLHQVHGIEVYHPDADGRDWRGDAWLGDRIAGQQPLPRADAAITAATATALLIRVADCVPVLFADSAAGLVAAAHAGRVGLLDGLLSVVVTELRAAGASRLRAWIGPHICGACYEVPPELAAQAAGVIPGCATTTTWGTPAIDLGAAAAHQLTALGVAVTRLDPCTRTRPELYSHRGDGPNTGRQAAVVWRSTHPA